MVKISKRKAHHHPPVKFPNLDSQKKCTLVAIDAGASHVTVTIRGDDHWRGVAFGRGKGADVVNGLYNIPTILAMKSKEGLVAENGQSKVWYGRDAYNTIHHADSEQYMMFRMLKQSLFDEPQQDVTTDMQRAIEEEKERAKKVGQDVRSLALEFFTHVLATTLGQTSGPAKVYVSMNELWTSKATQDFIESFAKTGPAIEVVPVSETVAAISGLIRTKEIDDGHFLVVDRGHSTLIIVRARVIDGETHILESRVSPLGAGNIDTAIENKLNEDFADGALDKETKFHLLAHFDEQVKPCVERELKSPPCWKSQEQYWSKTLMPFIRKTTAEENQRCLEVIQSVYKRARHDAGDDEIYVHVTGGGFKGQEMKNAMAAFEEKVRAEDDVTFADDVNNDISMVQDGLQAAADAEIEKKSLKFAANSIWLRHDKDNDEGSVAVRLVRKGQPMGTDAVDGNDRNLAFPLPMELTSLELTSSDTELELDLSVYGTPPGVKDEMITIPQDGGPPQAAPKRGLGRPRGKKRKSILLPSRSRKRKRANDNDDEGKCLNVFAQLGDLTQYGVYKKGLHGAAPSADSQQAFTVYIYISWKHLFLEIWAVYAVDGHPMPELENEAPMTTVLLDGHLQKPWTQHDRVDVKTIKVAQIVKAELAGPIGPDSPGQPTTTSNRNNAKSSTKEIAVPDSDVSRNSDVIDDGGGEDDDSDDIAVLSRLS